MKPESIQNQTATSNTSSPLDELLAKSHKQTESYQEQIDKLNDTIAHLQSQLIGLAQEFGNRTRWLETELQKLQFKSPSAGISICRICLRPDCNCPDRISFPTQQEADRYIRSITMMSQSMLNPKDYSIYGPL